MLSITPNNGLVASGITGGPFSPSSQVYTLTNSGTASLSWVASKSQSWVSLSVSSGTLASGASTTVSVSINSDANALAVGNYSDSVTFSNLTNGKGTTNRSVNLTISGNAVLGVTPGTTNICGTVVGAASGGQSFGTVIAGQVYGYQASGCIGINVGCGGPCTTADPDGNSYSSGNCSGTTNSVVPPNSNFTCNTLPTWSLVGKANGTCIQLGKNGTFTAPSTGTLVLYINDDIYNDNSGSWDVCIAAPTPFVSSGPQGGAFTPSSQVYTLTNSGTSLLAWAATNTAPWVSLSATNGTLAVGASTTVSVSINSNANSLAIGAYADTVTFTNFTNGNGTASRSVILTVNPIPAPSGLTATAISATQINLSWADNSSNEVGFRIERAPDSAGSPGTWTEIATVGANATTYGDSGLSPSTTYWYRVRAYSAASDSPYSNQASGTTLLGPPLGLTATAVSATEVNLSWTDNSSNEDGFKIERSVDGTTFTQIAQVLPNTTAYRDMAAWPGITYYYRVRAYRSGGNSNFSNTASAAAPAICPTSFVVWGDNSYGEFAVPSGLTNVVAIAAGLNDILALKSDGTVVGWGYNYYGQATPPAGLSNVVAIAASGHSLALKSDGTVVGWGDNETGQATPPAGLSNVVAIAAGGLHSIALKSDGTVICWGYNYCGQSTPPAGLSGVVAIAAGANSLALKSDGTVVGWGSACGDALPPAGLSGVVAISMSDNTLALKSDGTVVGWGWNIYGQATPPPGLAGVVAVAAAGEHSLAIKNDRTVVGWGGNFFGEATPPERLQAVALVAGVGVFSVAVTCTPAAPTNLTATAVAPDQIALSWVGASANEDEFKIEQAVDVSGSPGTWWQIATVGTNVTSYTSQGLALNAKYWYRVRAHNTYGDSIYSNQAGAPTQPSAPINLTTTPVSANQINVSWTDIANYEDGFKIERAPDNGGGPSGWVQIATVGPNVTGYSNTGLSPNTTYWYRVRAYNADGNSAYGTQANGMTLPLPPSNLAATTVSTNQIQLSWIGDPGGENGFLVERAPDNGGSPGAWTQTAGVGSNVTAYSDTGLAADATYWYRVRAYNASGNSAYGTQANGMTLPLPPSNLAATAVSENQINLSWIGDPSGESGFLVERAPDNGGVPGAWTQIASVGLTTTAYSDTGLSPNTTYWYRVRAYNGGGNSGYSNQAGATTPPVSAPSGLTATGVASNQINLAWVDNSNYEDGFAIERAPDNGGVPGSWAQVGSVSSNVTAYSDVGLLPRTTYWYRVRAFNANGNSDSSNQAGATTLPLPPAAPSGLTATPLSGSQISLSWADNTNDETGFAIERAPDSGGGPGAWAQITSVNSNVTTYTNTGLTTTTTYWYRVRAFNTGGYSPYSNEANATTLPNLPDSWISPASGKWETAGSWSLGVRPSIYLLGVLITNDSSKTVTIDATTVSNYPSTMTISNLTVAAPSGATNTLLLSTAGSTNLLHVLQGISLGSGGLLDVENSSLQVDSPTLKSGLGGFSIDGMLVFQNGGQITLSSRESGSQIAVGNVATGQMMISAGTVVASTINVGNAAGSQGTFTILGGATVRCSSFSVGQSTNATGAVWMTGGQLTTTNGGQVSVLYVGNGGTGQMAVSNGMVLSSRVNVGAGAGSHGTLTVVGGSVTVSSVLNIGSVSTAAGAVWVTGGQLVATGGTTVVGSSGLGRMTASGGSIQALSMVVGQFAGSQGSLTVSGGTVTVWSSLVVGDCAANASGQVTVVSGGSLFVTNASHTAFLDVREGAVVVGNGGVLVADRIIGTNVCGRIVHANGGTIVATTLTVDPSLSAVGDGIPNGWKQQYALDPFDPNLGSEDADGTGQNNRFKYVAGLDPTNRASVFVLNIASLPNQPQVMNLNFTPLAPGRTYMPQFSTDLVSGVWMPLTTYTGPVTNNGNQVTITDTNPIPPQKFYRIDITYP